MVRRKIDGSKAGYRSSMGREHLGGNKLRRRGERGKGRRGGRERREKRGSGGRREERRGERGRRQNGWMYIYGHTFYLNLLVPPTERLGMRLMPFKPCQQLSAARQ